MEIRIDQDEGPGALATTPFYIRVAGSGGTLAAVGTPGAGSAGLVVLAGMTAAFTTLNAAAGNTTGTSCDVAYAADRCTFVWVGTGTLAGTLTLEGSLDNTTYVTTSTTGTLTAAGTGTATMVDKPFRFYRVSLSGATGTGTVTVKLIAK